MNRIGDPPRSSAITAPVPGTAGEASVRPEARESVLILQSAHPKFVLHALARLQEIPVFANPRYELLCSERPDILRIFQHHPMITAIHGHSGARTAWKMLVRLREKRYDSVVLFFTGEPGYWKTKFFAFLLGARRKLVFNENGACFNFMWRATFSLLLKRLRSWPKTFRLRWLGRSRPSLRRVSKMVWRPVSSQGPEHYAGERILVLQSAGPAYVLRALDRLREAPLFSNPRYTLFCRAFPDMSAQFQQHPMLYEMRSHSATRNSWGHLRSLRRERYDAVVFLLTGEPGYWKIKCFAFLLGARHKVIFNENNDCFYFTWRSWFRLLAHRKAGQSGIPTQSRWVSPAAGRALFLIKFVLFPFRFAWLLIVWLRLRRSAMKAAG